MNTAPEIGSGPNAAVWLFAKAKPKLFAESLQDTQSL